MIPYTLIGLHCMVRRGEIFIVIILFSSGLCIFSSGSAGNQDDFSFVRSLSAFCRLVLQVVRTIFPSSGLSCILSSCSEGNQDDFSSSGLCVFYPLVLQAVRTIFPSSGLSCILSSGSESNQDDFPSYVLCVFYPLVLQAIRTIFPSSDLSLHFVLWFCTQPGRLFLHYVSLCILSYGPA